MRHVWPYLTLALTALYLDNQNAPKNPYGVIWASTLDPVFDLLPLHIGFTMTSVLSIFVITLKLVVNFTISTGKNISSFPSAIFVQTKVQKLVPCMRRAGANC